jgi:hypothetical protein
VSDWVRLLGTARSSGAKSKRVIFFKTLPPRASLLSERCYLRTQPPRVSFLLETFSFDNIATNNIPAFLKTLTWFLLKMPSRQLLLKMYM